MLRLGKFPLAKKSVWQSNFLSRPRRVRFSIYPDFRLKLGRYIAKILHSASRCVVCVVVRGVACAVARRYSRLYRQTDLDPKCDSRWLHTARSVGNKMVNVTIYDEAPQLKVGQCHGNRSPQSWSIKIFIIAIISWLASWLDIRVIGEENVGKDNYATAAEKILSVAVGRTDLRRCRCAALPVSASLHTFLPPAAFSLPLSLPLCLSQVLSTGDTPNHPRPSTQALQVHALCLHQRILQRQLCVFQNITCTVRINILII